MYKNDNPVNASADNFPASSDGETAGEAGKDIIHENIKSKDGKPFLDLKLKVKSPGKESSSMGWIRIGMSLDTLERQIRNSVIQGAVLVAGVLVLGLVLVLFIPVVAFSYGRVVGSLMKLIKME